MTGLDAQSLRDMRQQISDAREEWGTTPTDLGGWANRASWMASLAERLVGCVAEAERRAEYLQREINFNRRAMQHAGTWDQFCADYAAYKRYREDADHAV